LFNFLREEVIASAKASSSNRTEYGQQKSSTIEEQILEQVKMVKQWQENLDISVQTSQQNNERIGAFTNATAPISMLDWSESDLAKSLFHRMAESLAFPELHARVKRIACAHEKTFEWVLYEPDTSTQDWSSFVDWLQLSSDLYWITGKAGSGKSTLVKYIIQNPRTAELLKIWADQERLIVSGFYFWHAGTQMQKSQEGLLRTILYQVLTQIGKTISMSALLRWNSFALSRNLADPWTWTDLEQAFQFLLADDESPFKYCFFIDGLDELRGDLSALIKLVRQISDFKNVKVCVSSRPWMIFEDEYGTKSYLML
jgi:NACHT domain